MIQKEGYVLQIFNQLTAKVLDNDLKEVFASDAINKETVLLLQITRELRRIRKREENKEVDWQPV